METSINESILYSFKFQMLPFMTQYIHSISLKCRPQTNFLNLYWKCKSNSPAAMRHLLAAMAKNHHNHHSIEKETEIKSTFLLWSSVKSMISPFLQCKSHSLTDLSLLPDITSVLLWENLANVLHQFQRKMVVKWCFVSQMCVCIMMYGRFIHTYTCMNAYVHKHAHIHMTYVFMGRFDVDWQPKKKERKLFMIY